ncbi:MAG: cytochrome c biogenesis protein ResB [Gammaproteobacteria bacterium]|nr:cytochrome c biogenesis protein ResB [Gammaproteobacteria bacterium]
MLVSHGKTSMSDVSRSKVSRHTLSQRIFHFLGSMDLAITLLLALAVASVIGTVLQQNQPYTDYLIKFGPFWFEVFETAGLYDVYSALWFLAILTLLVISTSVCVIRHTPGMLRDMWNLRTHVQEKSLRAIHHNKQWKVASSVDVTASELQGKLAQEGFRVKQTPKPGEILVSAMRGGMNRLGYLLTHLAIIIICLGGLLDSNLPLKLAEWRGSLKIETRDLPVSQVPAESRLAIGSHAFRGSINIPEGRSSEVAFVAMRDGYLVQDLPFRVEVKDFRVEFYDTGPPKSFETDLIVHDEALEEPLATTISVNHPLFYKGYAIYQASFSDGGSGLTIDAWPLDNRAGNNPVTFETKVFDNRQMHWGDQSLRLEMTSFRPFNINPDPTADEPDRIRNFGPSMGFKLRSNTGEALEYLNYMLPLEREGREFYIGGVRTSPAEEFAYLYIPVDDNGEMTEFVQFLQRLHNKKLISEHAKEMMQITLAELPDHTIELEKSLESTLTSLVTMFMRGGFTEVTEFIDSSLPEAERDTLGPAYLSMLREMLARIYFSVFDNNDTEAVNDARLLFLQDAVDAIGSLSRYGSPVFLLLSDYNHVEASGLQVTRSPGKRTVYLGCALLIAGVFLLFYLPQRRFWALVKDNGTGSEILLAGMSNRNPREFDIIFEQVTNQLQQTSGNSNSR